MKILTVHPVSTAQEKALKAVFEAMEIPYEEEPLEDETTYLLSTEANRKILEASLNEANENKVTSININDLWK